MVKYKITDTSASTGEIARQKGETAYYIVGAGENREAFYIRTGRHTMTQDDILNGRLICDTGVATVRPGDFIVLRITREMER